MTCICCFLVTDERDAIQKKTFTKWVNKHLKKVSTLDVDFCFELVCGDWRRM